MGCPQDEKEYYLTGNIKGFNLEGLLQKGKCCLALLADEVWISSF